MIPSAVLIWSVPLILFAGAIAFFVILYNGIVQLRNDCDRAWSNIGVLLKQRSDEIPNLVRVCKEYIRHERETLVRVINARQFGLEALSPDEISRADSEMRGSLSRLFAVAEKYPDLKANESFAALQARITGIENEIADRREYFNSSVTNYNVRIQQLPDALIARWFEFDSLPLLAFRDVEELDDLGFDDLPGRTGTAN